MSRRRDAGAPRKLTCVLGFASSVPGNGETTTAGALGSAAADAEARDADTTTMAPAANTRNARHSPARRRKRPARGSATATTVIAAALFAGTIGRQRATTSPAREDRTHRRIYEPACTPAAEPLLGARASDQGRHGRRYDCQHVPSRSSFQPPLTRNRTSGCGSHEFLRHRRRAPRATRAAPGAERVRSGELPARPGHRQQRQATPPPRPRVRVRCRLASNTEERTCEIREAAVGAVATGFQPAAIGCRRLRRNHRRDTARVANGRRIADAAEKAPGAGRLYITRPKSV